MLTDRERKQIGQDSGDGREVIGLEYFRDNGARAGFETCFVEPGSGGDIVDHVRHLQRLGNLPGFKPGFRDVNILVHAKGYTELVRRNELDDLNSMNDGTFRTLRGRPYWIINVWGDVHPQREDEWIPTEAICLDLEDHQLVGVRRHTTKGAHCLDLRMEGSVQLYDKVWLDGDETIVVDFIEDGPFNSLGLLTCNRFGSVRAVPYESVEVMARLEQ